MDKFDIFVRPEEAEKMESVVAEVDPNYKKYTDLYNTGETIFVAQGGPELVVRCMANGAVAVSLSP